ncbi:MAG: CdaR family protein [Candidatus Goldbacteria bacterium]|nr:CdaR family protein [Candidatus Goldiibacteriota bacterium]
MLDFLRNLFLVKWQYKLAALITSFILWFYVVSEQNLIINISAPIEFLNFPSNMKITNKVRNTIEILLQGRRDIINKMDKKEIKVQIDLAGIKNGRNNFSISAAQIKNIPKGVSIINITPTGLTIDFEKIETQQSPSTTPTSINK